MLPDLLLMRAVLLNSAGAALLWVGIDRGEVQAILAQDSTYISEGIIALFAFGLGQCLYRIWECSQALNRVGSGGVSHAPSNIDDYSLWCARRRDPVDVTCRLLFRCGLLGTVYGFLMAMSELNAVNLTSAATAGAEIGDVIHYMGVAMVTTLTGGVTSVWLTLNQRMLEGGHERLFEES